MLAGRPLARRLVSAIGAVIVAAACVPPGQSPDAGGQRGGNTPEVAAIIAAAASVQAPGTAAVDAELKQFIGFARVRTTLGTRADEVVDLIRRSRAGAAQQINRSTSGSAGNKQAAEVTPISIMFLAFAAQLAAFLDPGTSSKTDSGERTAPPYTSTESGPTATVTTTLTTTESIGASGSVVNQKWHWVYRTSVVDKASGAPLAEMVEDRTMSGRVDVCPDAAGVFSSSLDVQATQGSTIASGGVVTETVSQIHRTNAFSGKVDDRAVLRTVTQDAHAESSSRTTTAGTTSEGSIDFGVSIGWAFSGGLGDAAAGPATGKGTGAASGDDIRLAAGNLGLDVASMGDVFKAAERLWRNGRCVVVTAPDYKAETPVSVGQQTSIQHSEEVQPSSETKFQVGLKHRFAGGLSQSVQTQLASGDKKLEPSQFESVPGTSKYTAPDELDKKATVKLESISKRGIGTLLLEFKTVGKKLAITISGTVVNLAPNVARFTGTVSIGNAEFAKVNDTTFEATGPLSTQIKAESLIPDSYLPCSTGSETGSVLFTARVEKRGETSVWIVHPDIARSHIVLGDLCGAAPGTAGGAAYAINLLLQLGDITIPIDGGTVPFHGARSLGPTTLTVDATTIATVGKT